MAKSTRAAQTCGYLGPEGSYTQVAASRAAPQAKLVPFATIDAVFEAVAKGEVERGVVPVENLIQGPVTEALDGLYHYAQDIALADMILLPIRHALGGLDAKAPISRVYSKDQALKQCSRYLQEHYPQATLHETPSTTSPMVDIAEGRLLGAAVVGSEEALIRHGLCVLARDIGNVQANKTKFVVFTCADGQPSARTGADSTLCVVYPHRDRVGLLRTVVEVISGEFGLNLSAIHSRPDAQGAFRFFLEVEGHMQDPTLLKCFERLRAALGGDHVDVVVVGSYPRTTFIEQNIRSVAVMADADSDRNWWNALLNRCGYHVHEFAALDVNAMREHLSEVQVVMVFGPAHQVVSTLGKLLPLLQPGQLLAVITDHLDQVCQRLASEMPEGVESMVMCGGADGFGIAACSSAQALAGEFEAALYKHGAKFSRSRVIQ